MAGAPSPPSPGGFKLKFHPRVLGSAAPVFPGFEVDITDRVSDDDKPDAVWHRDRARQMISQHPEIKHLCGNTPSTGLWCLGFVALQISIGLALSGQSFWIVLLVAYLAGPLININLFLLAHECNHNLVFKKTSWNRWLYTLTTLPMFLSGHHTWWVEHHAHHNDLGAKKDFVKRRRTFFLLTKQRVLVFTRGPIYNLFNWFTTPLFQPYSLVMLVTQALRSLLGLLVYLVGLPLRRRLEPSRTALAILADEHLVSGYERYGITRWAVGYPLASLGLAAAMYFFGGWQAFLYLFLSQLFMTGFLHPLMFGMILSNSHFHGHKRYQPSASYYGWFNWITFNFGLHTEHHDISGIPWSRLPRLRAIAPECYDGLIMTHSYIMLALQFVFCRRASFEQNFDNEVHRNLAAIGRNDEAAGLVDVVHQ